MCYNIIKTRFSLKAYKTESKLQKDGRFIARIILHRSETSSIKIAHFMHSSSQQRLVQEVLVLTFEIPQVAYF